ncbi:MAG TPA: prepilin-type N-terminal cleavage/methylation domain-containing protein [Candidatus Acidoferrum sp.]|jgi:type II secretory pathway pseudopilin PulG
MNKSIKPARQVGFSLLELLIAAAIFMVLCGAAFGLLAMSQRSYQNESQLLTSFQEARLGLDQIVRDVDVSGYPPANQFAVGAPASSYAVAPFAWTPGYPVIPLSGQACSIGVAGGGTCTTPGDFDVIIETEIDPLKAAGVQWIRYQLQGTTLMRAVAPKVAGADPAATTAPLLTPFVQNVVNNSVGQIPKFQALYPSMFPGGAAVPIFSYVCDVDPSLSSVAQPCPAIGTYNSPQNIRDVEVTLIVMTPTPDPQTGQPRLVELNGRGRRVNPPNF